MLKKRERVNFLNLFKEIRVILILIDKEEKKSIGCFYL